MFRRSSLIGCAAVVLAASVLAMPAAAAARGAAQTANANVRLLVPDRPMSGELSGGQSDVYHVVVEADYGLVVRIAQHTLVPLVIVRDPAGLTILETRARETSFVAASRGRYRIEVRADDDGAPLGRYDITVTPPRPASAQDRSRAAADQQFGAAGLLVAQATAGSVRSGIDTLKTALASFRQAEYRPGEIAALIALGNAYVRVGGETRSAREAFNEALTLAHASEDRVTEAGALSGLATTYPALPDRRKAIELYQEALTLYESVGDLRGQATALSNIGVASADLREYPRALELYERSLALSLQINDRAQTGTTYNNRGIVYINLGDLPQALDSFERARPLARATGSLRTQMMIANNTGIVYKELGDYPKALEFYGQAIALARTMGNADAEAQLLNNTGNIHKALGDTQKALDYYERALPMYRRVQNRNGESSVLNNIGSAYGQRGDFRQALAYHEQSRDLRKVLGNRSGESSSLTQAAIALSELGESDKAANYLREALEIRRQLGETLGQAETLLRLAWLHRDRGELTQARATIEQALDITETVRTKLSDGSLRASYVARVQETYESYIDVLMRQHAAAPTAGHDVEALQAAERTRARVLLESLVETRAEVREGVDASLLERERTLQRQLDEASERLSRGLSGGRADVNAARKAVDDLTAEYQQVQAQIRRSSRDATVNQPEPLTAAQIQRQILDDDTVLLEFALGEHQSWLWAVTPQSIASVVLPPRRDIEAAARSLYEDLTSRQPRADESGADYASRVAAADARSAGTAATVSRMLFGGIAAELQGAWRGKRLVIVAAGALEYLPFAALPVPQIDNGRGGEGSNAERATPTPLLARHEIVEVPSASVLATLRREASERQPARHAIAVVADPVFDRGDPRVGRRTLRPTGQWAASRPPASPSTSSQLSTSAALTSAASTSDNSYVASRAVQWLASRGGSSALARLPFTRDEARTIVELAGANTTLSATDFHATRAAVLGGALADYRIVHFATHGLIDTERPALSGLVLSLVNDRGAPQDGFLRLHDIVNMRLNADLVVLSACQTALGKEIKGEGLVGLTRGFMYAGTPRVVASLWQVSDLATADLMKKFYAGLLQRQLSPAAALRSAQLEMAAEKRWASPYFWAGFVLQGDWK